MTKVWIVTEGEYSDYHLVAVFSSKKKADKFYKHFYETHYIDEYAIEEWDVDQIPDDVYKENKYLYMVYIFKNGNIRNVFKTTPRTGVGNSNHPYREEFRHYQGEQTFLATNVWAKDEKHAVKVANERRTKHIALGTWKDDN